MAAPRWPLALLLALLTAAPALAQVQGLGYRLAPSGTYVFFDGDAALDDGLLYGGEVGISFGEFLELNGSYLFGSDFETDFSDVSGLDDDPDLAGALVALPIKNVDVQRYGGALKLNLARGPVVPFLTGGAGIVRFAPDGMESTRSLYLLGGAGLQFVLADRYALAVSADAFGYRYNPGTAFFSEADLDAVGLGFENFNQTEVLNPSVRAALQLYLGGRRPGSLSPLDREFQRQFSGGLSGLSLFVEPFYARTDFDPALDYSDQTFVGAEAGIDIGPLVGLRGFYGRGADDGDPTSFDDIQMYGGDVRLRLNAGDGLIPFVSVGAGYLDVLSGYAESFDDDPEVDRSLAESRPFAVGGAGLEVPIGRRLRAVGEVRALAMSAQDEGDVSQPDDVFLNPTFRAGLSLGLGGTAGRRVAVVTEADAAAERTALQAQLDAQRAQAAAREAELQAEIEQARLDGDAAAVARLTEEQDAVRAEADAIPATPEADRERMEIVREVEVRDTGAASGADGVARSLPTPIRTTRGERIVTIPLPETGELYVRYGDPGGVSIESSYEGVEGTTQAAPAEPALSQAELREIVRETLRETLAAQPNAAEGVSEADLATIERRVEDRIADRLGNRLRADDGVQESDLARIERRLEDRLTDEIRALRQALQLQQQPAAPVVVQPQTPAPTPVAPQQRPSDTTAVLVAPQQGTIGDPLPMETAQANGFYAVSPTVGVGFGRSENLLAGLRARYATGGPVAYLPELLLGVTGRRSVALSLDALYSLPVTSFESAGVPYLRGGIGIVNTGASDEIPDDFEEEVDDGGTSLTFNLGLGADLAVGGGRFFVDLTTANLGRYNRFTAGYRFPFGDPRY